MIFFLKFQIHCLVCLLFQITSQSLCRNVFSGLLYSLEIKLLHVETTELTNYATSQKLSHLKTGLLAGVLHQKNSYEDKTQPTKAFPTHKIH